MTFWEKFLSSANKDILYKLLIYPNQSLKITLFPAGTVCSPLKAADFASRLNVSSFEGR